ncbi:MAG: DEAD/DEAH box helicase [Bryobacterales bacterium]|nr:DEAD/DEAH box helicase [Bryobacterales bacterium]
MSTPRGSIAFAPGARVVVRDAEWVVRRVDTSFDGGQQLTCDGISELVRSQDGVFLTSLDKDIKVLDPKKTRLVHDDSPGFAASRLFIESQLRQAQPSDDKLRVGHLAAMDSVPYQLEPAAQALRQPRQRILIADGVGIGKTLESAILVSELIARGRGRRILVLAIKSMLTQFQKEYWNRFTIPLTRLDSVGIRRVRQRIPTNHNPFYYYDKAIISIDTLKQDSEYRAYLEDAYWDIIVIDEAHNVADRGTSSMRSRLAKLLSKRSDTLIMLSATPHDGKARSFASLMNMLDPTAIADPSDYTEEDFSSKGLVIRRFKKDIQDQVREAFRDREVHSVEVRSTDREEAAYEALVGVRVATARARSGKRDLFSVGLEKAMFSSPHACIETVLQRIQRREREMEHDPEAARRKGVPAEVESLRDLEAALKAIRKRDDSRYQALLWAVRGGKPFRWTGRKPDDRLVIFTERIATMRWLAAQLRRDLRLKAAQVETLHGGMSDVEQQDVVEKFGNRRAKIRLLVCSDVASEGINLHYRCHRLIHYDMPWSLMVFQQRNGRIDRYGQKSKPEIVYLNSKSRNETIRGDQRILEILRDKDKQAYRNIGDPSVFMNVHSIEAEEDVTRSAIAEGTDADEFSEQLTPATNPGDELLKMFLGGGDSGDSEAADSWSIDPTERDPSSHAAGGVNGNGALPVEPETVLSMFSDDLSYCEAALRHMLRDHPNLDFDVDQGRGALQLDAPADLEQRFGYFPKEIWPENGRFELTSDKQEMSRAIEESRRDERAWPRRHYLWRQNPVVEWINDRMLAAFGRHEAPVLAGIPGLPPGTVAFAFSGMVPNNKSHPLVSVWCATVFQDGEFVECITLQELVERTGLASGQVPNRGVRPDLRTLRKHLPEAVDRTTTWVQDSADELNGIIDRRLDRTLKELETLKQRQLAHLHNRMQQSNLAEALKRGQAKKKEEGINSIFREFLDWVQDTMTLESGRPWIKLLSVMTGEG